MAVHAMSHPMPQPNIDVKASIFHASTANSINRADLRREVVANFLPNLLPKETFTKKAEVAKIPFIYVSMTLR
jgi:hypothetical protein